ncbi:MAG TPA: ribosome small subunit-dependent GTPase A [Thermodesulfobacteriota bacterium]
MPDTGLLVLRVSREHLVVAGEGGRPLAAFTKRRSRIVVGDRVEVREHSDRLEAVRVLPRQSVLRRREEDGERVLAANVDRLVIVTAVGVQFRPGLVDRLLVAAEVDGIVPIIVLNKMDLPEADATVAEAARYERIGYRLRPTSVVTGQGIDALAADLHGHVSALVGHSGVGKSSLLNTLAPGAARAVAAVNPVTGKGRHTTSVAEGYPFDGGILIDLPGVREFGLAGVTPRRLTEAMPDLRAVAEGCRFADCLHRVEPGCAVREAVHSGAVDPARYRSYLRMLETLLNPDVYTRDLEADLV